MALVDYLPENERQFYVSAQENARVSTELLHRMVIHHRDKTPLQLRQLIVDAASRRQESRRRKKQQPEAPKHDWLVYWRQQFIDCTKIDPERRDPFWWREIIRQVSDKHGITPKQLVSHARSRFLVKARNEAYYRMRRETILSLPQIGDKFGGRDHTTVLHGIRRHCADANLPIPGEGK